MQPRGGARGAKESAKHQREVPAGAGCPACRGPGFIQFPPITFQQTREALLHRQRGAADRAERARFIAILPEPLTVNKQALDHTIKRGHIWRGPLERRRQDRSERYGPMPIPDRASAAGRLAAELAERGQAGLDPSDVAAQVLTAIRENERYVFTHAGPDWRAELEERFGAILAAMDKAAARR